MRQFMNILTLVWLSGSSFSAVYALAPHEGDGSTSLFPIDVAPVSLNIAADTSYANGSSNFTITPEILVANLGTNTVTTSFQLVMTVSPGGYYSSFLIPYLTAGFTFPVTLEDLTITLGQSMTITVYTTLDDDNPSNDTILQVSTVLPGTERNVLLEEWTSSTCGPCAANNPTIVAFVDGYWNEIVATKYHVGWPAPGNDPMYLHNPTQSYDRRFYYNVNTAPHVIMDGVVTPVYPYTTPGSLEDAFNSRFTKGSPLSVTVISTRTAVDSIRADVTVEVVAPMMAGNYFLRVEAIERMVTYTGPNGEPHHYDVFRRSYPNSTGTTLSTGIGTQNFTFHYKIDPVWKDTMVYTMAFVQNDLTKEVMNSGKSERTQYVLDVADGSSPRQFSLDQNCPNPFNPNTTIGYQLASESHVVLKVFNALGQEVRTLVNGRESAGYKRIVWDGLDHAGKRAGSGIYIYRLVAGNRAFAKKMLLLK